MNQPIQIETRDGYAVYRATGSVTLAQAVQIVKNAIATAREQGLPKLLIDISGLSGFDTPSVGDRYFFIIALASGRPRPVPCPR